MPVLRKYKIYGRNRTKCTEAMIDAHQMLKGLRLFVDGGCSGGCDVGDLGIDGGIGSGGGDGGSVLTVASSINCGPALETGFTEANDQTAKEYGGGSSDPGRMVAARACRKLVARLYAKVKSCMMHIGGGFNADDDQQLVARAYFEYHQQHQLQLVAMESKDRYQRFQNMRDEDAVEAVTDKKLMVAHARAGAGILTREQTKRQADDIARWYSSPHTDDVLKSRKPMSFRKSRIVIKKQREDRQSEKDL